MAQFAIDEILTTGIQISGFIFDVSNSTGPTGYILTSTSSGVMWKLNPGSEEIQATGTLLNNRINSLSGYVNGTFISGSGIQNYVPRWNSARELITGSIYDLGTGVGIGTTNPSARLQISKIGDNGSNGFVDYGILTVSSGYATQATLGAEVIGDGYSNLNLGSNIGGVRTFWHISKRLSTASTPHSLEYFYYDGSTFNQRFTFTAAGNLGIGTVIPVSKLTVQGDINVNYNSTSTNYIYRAFATGHAAANRGAILRFGIDDGAFAGMSVENIASSNPSFNSQFIDFKTHEGGVSVDTRMRITPLGYVGIGTVSPISLLSIGGAGSTAASSGITFGGDSSANLYRSAAGALKIDGSLGIGINPVQKLQVEGVVGNPASVGTTQSGIFRISNTTDNAVLDFGIRGGGLGAWIQSTDETSLAANYPLLLNPNGASVGIGITNPSGQLHLRNMGFTSQSAIPDSNIFPNATGVFGLVMDGDTYTNGLYRHRFIKVDRSANLPLYLQQAGGVANQYINLVRFGTHSQSTNTFEVFGDSKINGTADITSNLLVSGNAGFGTSTPTYQLTVIGANQATANLTDAGVKGGSILVGSSVNAVDQGGAVLFAAKNDANLYTPQFAIKSLFQNGMGSGIGDLAFSSRLLTGDSALTEVLRIKYDGKVGIGTNNPFAKLHVYAASNGNNWAWFAGNVGATVPSQFTYGLLLGTNYSNGFSESNLVWGHGISSNQYFAIGKASGNASYTEQLRIDRNGNVGIGTNVTPLKLNVSGSIYMAAGSGSAISWANDISSQFLKYDSVTDGMVLSSWSHTTFLTQQTERVRIASNGNVGIGVTNPTTLLQLKGDAGSHQIFSINRSGSTTPAVYIGTDGNQNALIASNNTNLLFGKDFVGTFNEYVRIASNGRVGIGFQTPTESLDVSGRIRAIGEAFTLNAATLTDSQTSIALSRLGAVTDQKYWEILSYNAAANGDFAIRAINDAYSAAAEGLRFVRGGSYNISSVLLPNGNIGIGTATLNSFINSNTIYFRPNPSGKFLNIYSSNNESIVNLISNNSGDGSGIGGIYFTRSRGQTDAHLQVAAIKAIQGGTNGTLAGGRLYFYTKSNGGGTLETDPAMIIDTAGNIGIGTTVPSSKLTIYDHTNGATVNLVGRGTDDTAVINFRTSGDLSTYAYVAPDTNEFRLYHNDGFMSLYPGGSEKVRFTAAGNVGIGVTNPGVRLQVTNTGSITSTSTIRIVGATGNGAGSQIEFFKGTSQKFSIGTASAITGGLSDDLLLTTLNPSSIILTAGLSGLAIFKTDGKVGIGMYDPVSLLSVGGAGSTSAASGLTFGQDAQANLYRSAEDTIKTDGNLNVVGAATLGPTNINGGTLGASPANIALTGFTYAVNNGNVSQITFVEKRFATGGDWTTATTRIQKRVDVTDQAYIEFNPSGALYGMALGVAAGGSLEAMRILSNGNIGVGTTNPGSILDLYKNVDGQVSLYIRNPFAGASAYAGVALGNNSISNGGGIVLFSSSWATPGLYNPNGTYVYSNQAGGLVLASEAAAPIVLGTSNTERMRISSAGNVGIGQTNPLSKFVVSGGTVNTTTYTTSEARIADGSLHLMKTVAGGVFEAIRAMNMDTTAGTTVRVLAASTSDPFNNGNGGKVFIDAIRTSTNMDLAFSLNDVAGAAAVERVRFMGNGTVGIGTASTVGKLDVYDNTDGPLLSFVRNASAGSSAYSAFVLRRDGNNNGIVLFTNSSARSTDGGAGNSTIRTDYGNLNFGAGGSQHILTTGGNVGINNTSPSSKLHVVETTPTGTRIQLGTNTENASMNAGLTNDLLILNAPYGTNSATVSNSGAKWGIKFIGTLEGNQFNSTRKTSAIYAVSEDPTAGYNRGTSLAFYTNAWFDQEYTERMRVFHNGNIGIGTTQPSYKLQIVGSGTPTSPTVLQVAGLNDAGGDAKLIVSQNPGASDLQLLVAGTDVRADGFTANDQYILAGQQLNLFNRGNGSTYNTQIMIGRDGGYGNISFSTAPQNQTAVVRMYIASGGNVGIGSISPACKLDVAGTIRSSSSEIYGFGASDSVSLRAASSSNVLGIYTSNVERLRLAANGYFGIGTDNPSTLLSIGRAGSTTAASGITFGEDSVANLYRDTTSRLKTDGAFRAGDYISASTYLQASNGYIYPGSFTTDLRLNVGNAAGSNWDTYPVVIKKGTYVGIGTDTPSSKLHVVSTVAGETVLRADGTNGTLFSVVDDLSDSLMSVNNSAGLPVLEVFADDRVVAGQYGSGDFVIRNNKVGIGATNPLNKLSVIGAASIGSTSYNIAAPSNGLLVEGNVGIGTTSVGNPLEVYGTSMDPSLTPSAASIFSVNSLGVELAVGRMVTSPFSIWLQGKHATVGGNLTYPIVLNPLGGNVGIGVTNPAWSLDVSGTAVRSFASGAVEPGFIADYASSNGYGGFFVHTNGVRKWRIAVVGDTDTSPALSIWQEGVGSRMHFRNNGAVGVGTTIPDTKLSIGVASDSALGSTSDGLKITDGTRNVQLLRNGTGYNYAGVVGSGSMLYSYDRMYIVADTSNPILFHAGGGERVRVQSNGNVGINTNAPTNTLQVVGQIAIRGDESADNAKIHIQASDNSNRYTIETDLDGNTVNDLLVFRSNTVDNMLVLKGNGNVGIGTTNPAHKLEVLNTANSQTYVRVNNQNNGAAAYAGLDLQSYGGGWQVRVPASTVFQNPLLFSFNEVEKAVLTYDGKLGIGITNPTDKIHISGGGISFTSSTGLAIPMLGVTATNVAYVGPYTTTAEGVSPSLVLFNQGASVQQTWFYSSGRVAMVLNKEGRLHIGNTNNTPNCLLSVGPSSSTTAVSGMCFGNDAQANLYRSAEDTIKTDGNLVVAGTTSLNGHIYGQKTVALSTASWTTVLTVNMLSHNSCYVKIGAFGDWSNHSAIAFVSELFIQNGDNAYNTPGTIITAHDNTGGAAGDKIDIQIVDPAAAGTQNFLIQLKLISATSSTNSSLITYHVMGQQASVT